MNNSLVEIPDWQNFTYPISGNIRDALKLLSKLEIRLLLIQSESGVLIGTVTEGDIRRALINGSEATASITECINTHPLVAAENDDLNPILQAMHNLVILAVPKITTDGKLIGLLKLSSTTTKLDENNCDVLIMAGGKGSRLGTLTNQIPKPLIKFGNETIIEIIIKKMVLSGFKNIYISIGHMGNQIKDYLQSGQHIGAKISYIEEEFPLGTAGSLSIFPQDRNNPILVINGDLITSINFQEMFAYFSTTKSSLTVAVFEESYQSNFGVVKLKDLDVISLEEKPIRSETVFAGIVFLHPKILKLVKKNTYMNMSDLINKSILENEKVSAFKISEYWRDIGTIKSLQIAQTENRIKEVDISEF
jgi:dTDP-glucose pyrophosphorylase